MSMSLDAISLPEDLIWADEYDWSNITQSVKKSLTGALIIQEASQTKGRTFTLTGDSNSGWIDKATLDLLKVKVDTVNLQMTLNYHGTDYNVMFNRSGNSSPMIAKPIYELVDPQSDHNYTLQLNFIEV